MATIRRLISANDVPTEEGQELQSLARHAIEPIIERLIAVDASLVDADFLITQAIHNLLAEQRIRRAMRKR